VRIPLGDLTFDVSTGGPQDGPPVLLLHGFPENATMWDGVVPALHAAGLRTFAPDQRGYSPGARPAEVSAYAMPELVGDVVGLLDALGLPAVHLVGHDWGSVVGWQVAGRHPDRVLTYTAVAVPHPSAYAYAVRHDTRQRLKSSYILGFQLPVVPERLLLAGNALVLRRMFDPLPDATREKFVRPMTEPGALTAALNWYRAAGRHRPARLGKVTVPTTYVWGARDVAVGRVAAEGCARQVTGEYEFVELPGVSHWVPEQEPDTVARLVLARVAGERPAT
jgi:pimeloyl-ACP methyl ester carboxylesterase